MRTTTRLRPRAFCVDCGAGVLFPMGRRYPRCGSCQRRYDMVLHRRLRRWWANRWKRIRFVFARGDMCPECQEYGWH